MASGPLSPPGPGERLKRPGLIGLMEKQAQLPSIHEIAGTDEIELEQIAKSTEDLIFQINRQSQTDELFEHPLSELLGLDKQLRNIRGSLKVEVAKSSGWKSALLKSIESLRNFENIPEFMMMQ